MNFFTDWRHAFRVLYRRPAFAVPCIITLALAIGANTAIFSVVNAVLLRPLPYKNPNKLVMIWQVDSKRGIDHSPASIPYFHGWQEHNQVFEQMAALGGTELDLTGQAGPERVHAALVSANFFSLLGVQPELGRVFLAEEDAPNKSNVAVISHGLWQRRFGGQANVVGKVLTAETGTYTIVGVAPPEFRFLTPSDVWIPLGKNAEALHIPGNFPARILAAITPLTVVARLKPQVTLDQAEANVSAITKNMQQEFGSRWGARIVDLSHELTGSKTRRVLFVLLAAVGLVLLIACANVANLQLIHISNRQRETAARVALGATRRKLLVQLLAESSVIAMCGGLLGVLLGWATLKLFLAIIPHDFLRTQHLQIDGTVLLFTVCLSLLTLPIFGSVPAIRTFRSNLAGSLREGLFNTSAGTSQRRLQGIFVVCEVCFASVLLIGALLTMKSLYQLSRIDLGIDPHNVLAMEMSLSKIRFPQPENQHAFFETVLNQARALPGVKDVGMVSFLPLKGLSWQWSISVEGKEKGREPNQTFPVNYRVVEGDYFHALKIPLIAGRVFSASDFELGANVAIINQAMANRFWPNQDALGKRIRMGDQTSSVPWLTIVGVVGNVKEVDLTDQAKPVFYVPWRQSPQSSMALVMRTSQDPLSMVPTMRERMLSIDPNQPVYDIHTLEEVLSDSVAPSRFNTLLLSIFAGLATIMALVGIYGVISYSIDQRRHEIGIRLALGADRAKINALILLRAFALVFIGIVAGLLMAAGLARFLANLLYEVKPFDAAVFAVVSFVLCSVAMLASFLSARRAAKIDPAISLRYE